MRMQMQPRSRQLPRSLTLRLFRKKSPRILQSLELDFAVRRPPFLHITWPAVCSRLNCDLLLSLCTRRGLHNSASSDPPNPLILVVERCWTSPSDSGNPFLFVYTFFIIRPLVDVLIQGLIWLISLLYYFFLHCLLLLTLEMSQRQHKLEMTLQFFFFSFFWFL